MLVMPALFTNWQADVLLMQLFEKPWNVLFAVVVKICFKPQVVLGQHKLLTKKQTVTYINIDYQ